MNWSSRVATSPSRWSPRSPSPPPRRRPGPVLANERFKWFYWVGFVLAASLVLWLLALVSGTTSGCSDPSTGARDLVTQGHRR